MVSGNFSRALNTLRGKNMNCIAAVGLGISNGGGISYVSVIVVAVVDGQRC